MYSELKAVLEYIVNKIGEHSLPAKYSELAQKCEEALSNPSDEIRSRIKQLTEEISNSQNEIEPQDFDLISQRIFNKFDQNHVLGYQAVQRMNQELSSYAFDARGASNVFRDYAAKISDLQGQAGNVLAILQHVLEKSPETEEANENERKLQLVFDEKVAIESFDSLRSQAEDWEKIFKFAAQIFTDGYPAVKIETIYKASPAVLTAVGPGVIIGVVSLAVKFALEIKKLVLSIKIEQEKYEASKYVTKQEILKALREEEKLGREKAITDYTKQLIAEHKISKSQEAHATLAAKFVITNLYNFTINGGQVSLVDGVKKEGENPEDVLDLNRVIREVRNLQKDLGPVQLLPATISQKELDELEKSVEQKNEKEQKPIEKPVESPKAKEETK